MSLDPERAVKKLTESTVKIPVPTIQLGPHPPEMLLRDILERIEQRLRALDLTASAASRAAGLTEDAIRNLRRAVADPAHRRGVNIRTLEKLAPVLRTTVEYLLRAAGPESLDAGLAIPIIGVIGAGGRVQFFDPETPPEYLPRPAWFGNSTVALEINGGPLNVYFPRWFAYYDDLRQAPGPELSERMCVAALADGRVYALKARKATEGNMWHLLGRNADPITDVELLWAAEVRALGPRR